MYVWLKKILEKILQMIHIARNSALWRHFEKPGGRVVPKIIQLVSPQPGEQGKLPGGTGHMEGCQVFK